MVVTVGKIVSGPTGTGPNGTEASYNPANNVLTIPAGIVGTTTYYNVGVTVGSLISIDDVAGADIYSGGKLTIPSVQVLGGFTYTNVVITVGAIIGVAGGMPAVTQDVYNAATNRLTIPAVLVGNRVYTNVTITPGTILSIGGHSG
jgi:hypothetical protein